MYFLTSALCDSMNCFSWNEMKCFQGKYFIVNVFLMHEKHLFVIFYLLLLFEIIEYFLNKLFETNLTLKWNVGINLQITLLPNKFLCHFIWCKYLTSSFIMFISSKNCSILHSNIFMWLHMCICILYLCRTAMKSMYFSMKHFAKKLHARTHIYEVIWKYILLHDMQFNIFRPN